MRWGLISSPYKRAAPRADHVVGEVRGDHRRGADQQHAQHLPATMARTLCGGDRLPASGRVCNGQPQRVLRTRLRQQAGCAGE